MIDFVILNTEQPSPFLELVKVYVSHDLSTCSYSPSVERFSPEEIEGFTKKAVKMKHPDSGDVFLISPIFMSENVQLNPEAAQKHIKGYLGHPLRYYIARLIERTSAAAA